MFAGDVQDGSGNQEFLLFFRRAHSEVPTHTTPGTSSTLLNHSAGIPHSALSGIFFPQCSFPPSGEANET